MTKSSQLLPILLSLVFAVCSAQPDADPCKPTDGKTEVFTTVSESSKKDDQIYTLLIPGNNSVVTLTSTANSLFRFDPSTKTIVVNGVLDAETNPQSYQVEIVCREKSTGRQLKIMVNLQITDANDHSPVFSQDVYNLTIGEMTEVDSTIITSVTATDGDATPDFNLIYYSIVEGPYKNYFTIANPLTATLTLRKGLDYETLPQFSIIIMAMDQPKSGTVQFSATCTLIIIVKDEDDQYPVFNSSLYRGIITDKTTVGSVVAVSPKINAYDPDITLHARVTYSFHGPELHYKHGQMLQSSAVNIGNQNFPAASRENNTPLFNIDPNTAEVTLVSRPSADEVYLLVQATQVDNPSRYGVALLAVSNQRSDTKAPEFTRNSYHMVVPEVFPVGEVVTTVLALTSDSNPVTYRLNDPSNTFRILPDSGDIVLIRELSYVLKQQYVMTATASKGTLESNATVTITVQPVHNTPPQIVNSVLNVTSRRLPGEFIIDIEAKSSDNNTEIIYSIITFNDLFSIDEEGIMITTSTDSSSYILDTYPVTVVVSARRQPAYETAAVVYVSFPKNPTVASAQVLEENNIAVIVLAAIAALFLVVIIILVVYICRRRLRDEEHFDRVKKQHTTESPKALTFRQKQGANTLARQGNINASFQEDNHDGCSNIQENPLNCSTKGSYYNFCNNSDTETEPDAQENQVEAPFELHPNDTNNNSNSDAIYNTSQSSMEYENYSNKETNALTPFYRNGSVSTYRDSSASDASFSLSPSASSDYKKVLAPIPQARSHVPKEKSNHDSRDSDDSQRGSAPPSQKQELTVYF